MQLSEDALEVHLSITSKNVQLNNFVTGEWISKWVIRKDGIEGTVNIRAHFFESGNVQFNQKRNIKKDFAFKEDMTENAKNIIKVIEFAEGDIQSNLNDLYDEMPNSFFKNLRRVMPKTKLKMVWNINSIKMNRNLLGMNK
jgi:capping protein (actin filament) muscle Z-line, alpha